MLLYMREFYQSRELLYTWTMRDFKVRYSQSLLGIAWAILQPLSLMLIFSVIFSLFIKVPTEGVPYPLFAYTSLLPWTFFSNALSFAIPSLVNNMNLVSKIYFPREILPLSSILVCLLDFIISISIYVFMLLWYHWPIGWSVLFVPVILSIQLIFMYGISLLASAINVFYRDVRFIIPLAVQIWMYISPVIYPVSLVPERLQPFYLINPMAVIIDSYRRVILYQQAPDWPYLILATAISLLLLLLSYRYFKKAEREFADLI
ncbi:MAG: ABC transporter permease [Anaerolineaceae bacterium]|nr:ABC transporter permease [Anaerolineaceae bacterium]